MADPNGPATGTGDPRGAALASVTGELARQSASLATPGQPGASDPAGPGGSAADPSQDDEREVDWGGTTRKVKIKDLVSAAMEVEAARADKALADRKLQEVATLQGINNWIRKLSPQRRERMSQILADASLLDAPSKGKAPDPDDLLDEGGSSQKPGVDPAFLSRLDRMEQVVGKVVDMMSEQVTEKRHADLGSQIDSTMKQFSAFDVDDVLTRQAKARILTQFAQDEGASLLGIVTKEAQETQNIVDRVRGLSQAPRSRGVPDVRPGQSGGFTGKDLLNGTIDDGVLEKRLGLRR